MIHIVPVSEIRIGERRREDMGDLDALAKSIERYGLLHAIVISEGQLVAGERRLAACRDLLGWEHIECKNLGELTEDELREIELEENLRRKDLTEFERAKDMVEVARIKAKRLREDAEKKNDEPPELRPSVGRNSARGRPVEVDSERTVADEIGVPRATLQNAKRVVATAERLPVVAGPAWKQGQILDAGKKLGAIKDDHHQEVAKKMIAEPFIPPETAVRILTTLAEMPDEDRAEVVRLYESDHSQDQSLAKTRAMQRDPMPDPRAVILARAAKDFRQLVKGYPDDPLTPQIEGLIEPIEQVVREIQEAHKERVNGKAGIAA